MQQSNYSRNRFLLLSLVLFFVLHTSVTNAQTELAPWGNITGIRIDGQLMDFETSLRVVHSDWSAMRQTAKERQRPHYERHGASQVVTTVIDSFYFSEEVSDAGRGAATVKVKATAHRDEPASDVYISLSLPSSYYEKGTMLAGTDKAVSLGSVASLGVKPVRTIRFISARQQLQLDFPEATQLIFKTETRNNDSHLQVYIPVRNGGFAKDASAEKTFSIKISGPIDNSPVALEVNTSVEGRVFDGFGGNFRLQNPRTDPQVIDYSLANLRVAWSRIEMPWRFWQPQKEGKPIDSAKNGKLHPAVQHAMEMAQRLSKMNIPIILSAWSAPAWAVVGTPKFSPGPDGVWGNPLDTNSMNEIYQSIGDYVSYLKDQYSVEISLFSFNESDLGINIRQTGEEHAALIRGLGAYFVKRGLKTKMLLGDNSDATTYTFIDPALNDPSTHPFIGAVSFHSWRGWDTGTLQKWREAAEKLNLPLLVAEGSIDAQAWGYPAIFEEPTYALQEINLYTRLLAICQPLSILQWQLTADYSVLSGGGIFGNTKDSLHPTQRFWNLKQLSSTPKDLKSMKAGSDKATVTIAALGDKARNVYAIHLVNNGPSRKAVLKGLPTTLKSMRIFITDQKRSMKEAKAVPVVNGKASFILEGGTYTSLIAGGD